MPPFDKKPDWLRVRAPGGATYQNLKDTLRRLDLHTVCEEARCPNVGECWREGTATVMLLGDTCTRGCRFCAVTTGKPGAVDEREPEKVAFAIGSLALQYVVLTMVDRDDLSDGGAAHVARTVRSLRELRADLFDRDVGRRFSGAPSPMSTVVDAAPDVFAHNVEVVRRLTRKIRDVRCGYDQSLAVLRFAKERAPSRITKSSIMVGLGESAEEVHETLEDLRAAGVDIVTIGQYLRPSAKHHEVVRYVTPAEFAEYERVALAMGFLYVASGPLVRSSYKAAEVFVRSVLRPTQPRDGHGEQITQTAADLLEDRLTIARREAARVAAMAEPSGEHAPGPGQTTSELFARSAADLLGGVVRPPPLVPVSSLLAKRSGSS